MFRTLRVPAFLFTVFCLTYSAEAATFTVTKMADTADGTCDSDCSFREAVTAANNAAGDDTVEFDATVFNVPRTIVLSGGEILIGAGGSLTIAGPGAGLLTIDGNNATRIIRTGAGVVATINGITFTRGNGASSVNNNSGGAILNDVGTLTINDSVFINNVTSGSAGAVRNSGTNSVMTINNCFFSGNASQTSSAGALQNFSTSSLVINGSTFIANTSGGGTVGGGAIQANGQVRITNSTFSGNINQATGGGGAINSNGSLLVLTNVTMTANASGNNGGGLHRSTTNVNGNLRNTIIAGNNGASASPDVTNSAGGITSLGNNLIGSVGTSTGWVASDILNMPGLLTPLGHYGGKTMTVALLSGSPALNTGTNCVLDLSCSVQDPPAPVTTDQRGASRPAAMTVDIGAFESNPSFTAVLPTANPNQPYSFTITPDAGSFMYTVTSGSLPPGMMLTTSFTDESKAAVPQAAVVLTGTPTQNGVFTFSITMTNGSNSAVVNYQLTVGSPVTSATVSGQVSTAFGPVGNAIVILDSPSGQDLSARTNTFGFYRIEGVATGVTYTASVQAKGNSFASQMVTVSGDISDLDFIGTGSIWR